MKKPPPGAPWAPAPYTIADVTAIQALDSGRDVPGPVAKRALDWIINTLCETYGMSYRPDSHSDTDFAEGKRFVGNQIVKMTKLNVAALKETDARNRRTDRGRTG